MAINRSVDEQQKRLAEEFLTTEKKSFVKSLYFGLYQDVAYPESEVSAHDYAEKVKVFAKENVDSDWIDRHAEIPKNLVAELGKIGLLGLTIPKEYGGLGMSQYAYCKAMEELASFCGSTALFVNAHQSVGLKALLLFGTEEQKKRYLPPLAKGEQIAAFSLTEPNAGSDASAIETQADYDPEKKVYRLNGQKQWTTNGSLAQVLTVMAKTEDRITAFLVTPDMKGFKVLNQGLEKVGMRGTKTSNLAFENMEVPEENILGPKGKGLKVCLTVLDYGRTTFGATCTGTAKTCLKLAVDYSKNRIQFKRPLASFSLVKKKIVQIAALTYAMDATTYLTAGLIDQGKDDVMLEAAILKVFASESLWTIIYETMQIFGGKSFFTDQPLERMMRDARLNMIGEGANEVLRAFIAVVGLREVGLKKSIWQFLKQRFLRPAVSSTKEGKALGKAVKKFGMAVIKALLKYREGIVEKQLILDRIAEAAISLYTATAVLKKMEHDPTDSEIGKWYFKQAMDRVHCSLNWLFVPQDEEIESLSDQITGM